MKWQLIVANSARRVTRDMPHAEGDRIAEALEEMRADPYVGDIKYLNGSDRRDLRRRVGAWRVIYEVDAHQRLIVVHDVRRRASHTY